MLDYFCVFARGGALLFTLPFVALRHSPTEALNALIRSCLLEERSGDHTFTYAPKTGAHQTLKWSFHNVRVWFYPVQHHAIESISMLAGLWGQGRIESCCPF